MRTTPWKTSSTSPGRSWTASRTPSATPTGSRATDMPPVQVVPTDYVDYCGGTCGTTAVTPWVDETCACCGRVWGYDNDPQDICHHKHVEGDVWWQLLDAEQK